MSPAAEARVPARTQLLRRRAPRSPLLWFVLPAGLVLLLVDLGPMLYALYASFTHWVLIEPGSENDPAGLSNYVDLLRSGEFWSAVRVTIIYAVCSITAGLVLGTAIALALDLDFYARAVFRSAMMIPMVITPSVIGIFWKLLYEQESGVFNTMLHGLGLPGIPWLGVGMALPSIVIMDVWQTTPFFMLVILAGLNAVDASLIEAGRVDGATRWQGFRHILLPHLVPYMLIAAAFRAIAAMGDFDKIWLLTSGGPGERTTTITIYAYKTGFSAFDIGRTAALAWIFVVIVLVVSAPLLRHLFRVAAADA